MPDPKLQTAMEEIKAVLRKYDIGASLVLASPTHMESLQEFSTSWSCMKLEDGMLRIRSNHQDYPSKEAQKKMLEQSIGMLCGFADWMTSAREALEGVLMHISKTIPIEHVSEKETRARPAGPGPLDGLELFAWVGEDEMGSGEIGLKQALTRAGMIPLVGTNREKMEQPVIVAQLTQQASVYGKTISLGRFVFDRTVKELPAVPVGEEPT